MTPGCGRSWSYLVIVTVKFSRNVVRRGTFSVCSRKCGIVFPPLHSFPSFLLQVTSLRKNLSDTYVSFIPTTTSCPWFHPPAPSSRLRHLLAPLWAAAVLLWAVPPPMYGLNRLLRNRTNPPRTSGNFSQGKPPGQRRWCDREGRSTESRNGCELPSY